MIRSTASEHRPSDVHDEPVDDLEPHPPAWARDLLGPTPASVDAGPHVHAVTSGPIALLTTTIALASEMPADTLRSEVALSYRRLERSLAAMQREAIRFWNFIPAIGKAMGPGLDRYMVFNAGRHEAVAPSRKSSDEPLDRPPATASAVGVSGTDLVVHCLASATRGVPVENPRQISSWRYSARYGPRPPCFSRATIAQLNARTVLLIGGTASIVGEQSLHLGDIESQLHETLRNIGALVIAARAHPEDQAAALRRLLAIRVYVADDGVARIVRRRLAASCPHASEIEIFRARMCRPELLVEIEGMAEMDVELSTRQQDTP